MAYEDSIRSITFEADATLAVKTGVPGQNSSVPNKGKQYLFVKLVSAKTVGLETGSTGAATVGVLQNKPQVVGGACTVAIRGVSMVEAGEAITAGSAVSANANGQAVAADDAEVSLGIAIEAAANALELIPVLLRVN